MKDFEYNAEGYKALKGNEALKERLKGRLPIIDIHGHSFFVDIRIGYLRPMDNFLSNGINVLNKEPDPETKRLSFYYHIPSMSEYEPTTKMTELPMDVVWVTVPNVYLLDPIGAARQQGLDDLHFYVKGVPLKMYSKAKVTPLKKSPLAVQVKGRSQRSEPRQETIKKAPKRKRGKGI